MTHYAAGILGGVFDHRITYEEWDKISDDTRAYMRWLGKSGLPEWEIAIYAKIAIDWANARIQGKEPITRYDHSKDACDCALAQSGRERAK